MALPKYKDIIDLIKKGSTIEAQEKILELRESALDLQEDNLALKEENMKLKAIIKKSESLHFDGKIYWLEIDEGKDGPFCPKCHDVNGMMVRMHQDGNGWWCYTCSQSFGTASY